MPLREMETSRRGTPQDRILGLALDMLREGMEGHLDGALHWAAGYKLGLQDRGSSKEMDLQVAHIEMMI